MRFSALLVVSLALAAAALGSAVASPSSSAQRACAPGYRPCLPVRADLDCDQIADALKPVRVTGADQYDLDRDRAGFGCDVEGQGGGARSPWGVILQKPRGKEATSAKAGDTLTVVGWSPRSMKGKSFQLCSQPYGHVLIVSCVPTSKVLTGSVQTFGKWKVPPSAPPGRLLKVSLMVLLEYRALDTVPIR